MSERGDFFSSASAPAKAKPTRADFFAGKVTDEDVDASSADEAQAHKEPGFWERFSRLAFTSPEAQLAEKATPEDVATAGIGAAEGAANTATAIPANLAGGLNMSASLLAGRGAEDSLRRFNQTRNFLTYDPRTPMGDVAADALGEAQSWLGPKEISMGADKVFDLTGSPLAATVAETGGNAALMLAGGKGALSEPKAAAFERPKAFKPVTPQDALNQAASSQSMGAAGAAVDLQKLSPDMKAAVQQAVRETRGAVNPEALARHIQADSLPVKIELTDGQATQNPAVLSAEMNNRGKHPELAERFNAQNKQLIENMQAFRDEVGPDVFTTNQVEHADTLIGRYKQIDDARRAEITEKYKALEEANGGQFPVNGKSFVEAADTALSKKMKTRYLPKEVAGDLEEFRSNSGMMTFEQFENLRTNLAAEARKAERSGDGNAAASIGIVRRELENLPIEGDVGNLKTLADDARKAAKARFDALDADPAYKAAVNDSVAPDAFVKKYVIGGTRDDVAKLSEAMRDDPVAAQTMSVAILDHLKKSAGIDSLNNNNFSQAAFNKALQALDPKIRSLVAPDVVEKLNTLGDVARYTQFQPRGSSVNNSNTAVALMSEGAKSSAEGAANVAFGGVPVGTWTRKALEGRAAKKAVKESLKPGAGLTRLSDLMNVGKGKK